MIGTRIGDYIHYRYENYMRYGLAMKLSTQRETKRSLGEYYNQAIAQAKSYGQKVVSQGVLIEMSKKINFIMGNEVAPDQDYNLHSIREAVIKLMQETYSDITVDDINWETLTIKESSKSKFRQRSLDKNEIIARLPQGEARAMSTLLGSSLGRGKSGMGNLKNYRTQIKNLEVARELLSKSLSGTTLTNINNQLQNINNIVNNLSKTTGRISNIQMYNGTSYNLSSEIRKIAKAMYGATLVNIIEGDLWENVTNIASNEISVTLKDGVKEILKPLTTGSSSGTIKYDKSNFASWLNTDSLFSNQYYNKVYGDYGISYELKNNVKGKVDVLLQTNSGQILGGLTNKSYALSGRLKDIGLVKGTNLLYLFQSNGEFLNHYLNQTQGNITNYQVILYANDIMRKMIVLSGFMGGGLRARELGPQTSNLQASIFAINNKSKEQQFSLVSVYSIFTQLLSSFDMAFEVSLNKNQTWPNNWQSPQFFNTNAAHQRIQSLVANVRGFKIDASLKISMLQLSGII